MTAAAPDRCSKCNAVRTFERAAIRQVLAADPENADALRAIAMLEQAMRRRQRR